MSENHEPEGDDDMTAPPAIWLPPPSDGGYTSEDLDRLPGLPPHTELIDGGLYFVSPQKNFHTVVLFLLEMALRRSCPVHLVVRREMSVRIGRRQRPEPDLIVVRADAVLSLDQTYFPVEAVELAVEVVSPDSEERDRERKPQLYAEAGIKYFWRVERSAGGWPAVYVFELDWASKSYHLKAVLHDRFTIEKPFEVEINFAGLEKL